jgi:hypothetical protein
MNNIWFFELVLVYALAFDYAQVLAQADKSYDWLNGILHIYV